MPMKALAPEKGGHAQMESGTQECLVNRRDGLKESAGRTEETRHCGVRI